MKRPVLIVTPDPKLGELIISSLAETFQYDAHCFGDLQPAVEFLQEHRNCEHLLIETTLGETAVLELGLTARRIKHNIKLTLVSRSQPSARFDELRPWRLLRQPFLLPDLFAVLDAVPPSVIDVTPGTPREPAQPTWLDDRTIASSTLRRLAVEMDAQEVLIMRENDLWASAGGLSSAAVKEIMGVILGSMDSGDQFDLLRFMKLTSQRVQHGVWARLLMVNVILAAIYDADASINEMRTQTNALADALFRPLLSGPQASDRRSLPGEQGLLDTPPQRSISPWSVPDPKAWSQPGGVDPRRLSAAPGDRPFDRNGLAVNPAGTGEIGEDFGDVPQDARRQRDNRYGAFLGNDAEWAEEEPPVRASHRAPVQVEEPGAYDLFSISYSCLLTPRFETHPMRGGLAEALHRKMEQICTSYGWELRFVEVQADCLHWVVMVPPTETVADHIQRVRQMTSVCVFEEYPEYARENLSQDFWAPGYSLLTGSLWHTPAQIQAYARNRRERYGSSGLPPAPGERRGSNPLPRTPLGT
jgi:REP element-mobilizing transposase RayT